MGTLQLQLPIVPTMSFRRRRCLSINALSKQGNRFLTSVATTTTTTTTTSSSATRSLLRKFVSSSNKHVAIETLSHLLSPTTTHPHLAALAYPLYLSISEASWFNWNGKLVADVIAVLQKDERFDEAEALMIETIEKIGDQERHTCNFYCYLIESIAKHQLKDRVRDLHESMKKLFCQSPSVYIKKRAYASIISSLCEIGQPREAEALMEEIRVLGLKQSSFELRCLVYAYGKIGSFGDVFRIVDHMQRVGFQLDTVSANMVLASLGSHGYLSETVSWLQRMKTWKVSFSARTYNSVLNSCSSILLILQELKTIPLSLEELMNRLPEDEAGVIQELVESSVIDDVTEWRSSELKLDLHGMHSSSSYLIFLQWIDVLRIKFGSENQTIIPNEVTVVCGSGKHSAIRGQSPVKSLIKEMIISMKFPMKIDRRNLGCFVAKGKVIRDWLRS